MTAVDYTVLPDSTRAYHTDLSFRKHIRNKYGKHLRTENLMIPDENYLDGHITGFKCLKEFLDYVRCSDRRSAQFEVAELFEEVFRILDETREAPHANSKRGAAVAILDGLREAIILLAMNSDYTRWINEEIQKFLTLKEIEYENNRKRTTAARKAKAAKRERQLEAVT